MISRRDFLLSSLAVSAGSLSARVGAAPATDEPPQGRATLRLHFVGGTAFRRVFDDRKLVRITAVQLSGKCIDGRPFKHPSYPYSMPHRSYIVLPAGTVPNVDPFPDKYETTRLHSDLTEEEDWQPVCLAGKDVTIEQSNGTPLQYKCDKVASYKDMTSGFTWQPIGRWQDHSQTTLEPMINSRFKIEAGVLDDGRAQDHHGSGRLWKVGRSNWKGLSDVAILTIQADSIAIKGIYNGDINVPSGKELRAYVFAGPDFSLGQNPYYRINHALLIHTIYKITPELEIRPWSDKPVTPMLSGYQKHPCDLQGYYPAKAVVLSPPDSEYCTNYDEFP